MSYKLIKNSLNDINNIIDTILLNRGIDNPSAYLNLDEAVVQDYNCLEHMQDAVQCFVNHYMQHNKIIVMPDEDCDGYTSSAMLYLYIKSLDSEYPIEYIMHQKNKTHGLNSRDYNIPDDAKLFIIADASTNDITECNELIKNGIDIIILDHHDADYQEESEEEIDYKGIECNKAIIVNNQLSPDYINKDLSGAGVVYRFLQALDAELWEDYADNFLDLCAVGNIADVMDMRSFETRYLVDRGIDKFENKFLQALFKAQEYSMHGIISIHNIAWYMAPVINAIARIGTLEERELLFRAMIEQDEVFEYNKRGVGIIDESIYDRAARIAKNAKSRQDKQRDKVFDELKESANLDDKVVMLESKIAQSGLVGLSAMKLADTLKRPVIIVKEIEKNGEMILSGSCRNFDNSPIEDFKQVILDTNAFLFCSGHGNAAGLAIKPENVDLANSRFREILKDKDFNVPIPCDFVIDIDELDIKLINDIENLNWLWGTGIKEPVVAVENVCISRKDITIQGKAHDSVFFMIDGIKFVQFKMSDGDVLYDFINDWEVEDNDEIGINVIGTCSINEYNGILTPQFIIQDVVVI